MTPRAVSPATAVNLAVFDLIFELKKHGLDHQLDPLLEAVIDTAFEWGQDEGYRRALTAHHIPTDD
jgi:hypothetical protein